MWQEEPIFQDMNRSFRQSFVAAAVAALLTLVSLDPAHATEAAWARLSEGGYTILLGHARTPGGGEPARPDIGDCAERRSLSDRGIQEARRIGMRFAARAVFLSQVYSGQYCRALKTAELAVGRSRVEPVAWLNPPESDADVPPELVAAVESYDGAGNQLMVTHPDLIFKIVASRPREGEAIIIAPPKEAGGELRVVGRLLLD